MLGGMEWLCPHCPPPHAPCPRAVALLNILCSQLLFLTQVAVPEVKTPVMLPRAGPSHGEQIASCALCTPGLSVQQIYMVSAYTYIHTLMLMVLSASPAICCPSILPFLGRPRGPSVFANPIEMFKKMFFEQSIFFFLNYRNIN